MMGLLLKAGLIGGAIAAIIGTLIIFRTSITSGFAGAGQTVGESFGGFFGGIGQGITESFSEFQFPSFDFGNGGNGGAGASELAGETVPLGTEGDLVQIPEDTMVSEEGIVTSETPPVLIPSDETRDVLQRAQEESRQLGDVFQSFSAGAQLQLLDVGVQAGGDVFNQFAAVRQAALESIGDPELEGSQGIGFFDVFNQPALPLSQFAIDFLENIGVNPVQSGGA